MPAHMSESNLPCREYYFNVMNTVMPNFLAAVIEHAHEIRYAKTDEATKNESILISEEWYQDLLDMPFQGGKKGKMVHLLSQGAKPVKIKRIRRKYPILDENEWHKKVGLGRNGPNS